MGEYASKYYDPVKAHEYYMKNRELKGYENRYGGSRGDGTSAASNGGKQIVSKTEEQKKAESTKTHNKNLSEQIKKKQNSTKEQINSLREQLRNMSKEDKKANRQAIQEQINALREASQDEIQRMKQQTKGGSTSGFNQKGMEAASYIKKQMEEERDNIIKKTNKDVDRDMLADVWRLQNDIEAMRKSGRGFGHKEFLTRINKMLGKAKKKKEKAKKKRTSEYKQKYKDEIDKLRGDESMYDYWDKKTTKLG